MRVVSQDRLMDYPYDKTVVFIDPRNKKVVNAKMIGDSLTVVLGEYPTEERALKAMGMLRETYMYRMELDGGYDHVNQCYVQPNYWVLPRVFQFPADDEIETMYYGGAK